MFVGRSVCVLVGVLVGAIVAVFVTVGVLVGAIVAVFVTVGVCAILVLHL